MWSPVLRPQSGSSMEMCSERLSGGQARASQTHVGGGGAKHRDRSEGAELRTAFNVTLGN